MNKFENKNFKGAFPLDLQIAIKRNLNQNVQEQLIFSYGSVAFVEMMSNQELWRKVAEGLNIEVEDNEDPKYCILMHYRRINSLILEQMKSFPSQMCKRRTNTFIPLQIEDLQEYKEILKLSETPFKQYEKIKALLKKLFNESGNEIFNGFFVNRQLNGAVEIVNAIYDAGLKHPK